MLAARSGPASSRTPLAGSRIHVESRLLTKRKHNYMYILESLHSADISIFATFIMKHMEEKEAMQLSFYDNRRRR